MSSSFAKAITRKTLRLPAWPDVDILIRRVSVKQIGLDAGLRIVSNLEAAAMAAQNAEEAKMLVQQANMPSKPGEVQRQERPPTPEFSSAREDRMSPEIKRLIIEESELVIVKTGLVSPSYEAVCDAYGADPERPQEEMGPDWDILVKEIMEFSGEQSMGHLGMRGSPAEIERFPENARLNAQRNGQAMGQNSSRTRKRKRR